MPPTPSSPAEPGQRLLAAIVFTDVAGFSRRVQAAEAATLKLLERDFITMRAFSAMHSGRVIKSTGDGLMLFFSSAVQAVEWSLKTQRHFADQAAELPAGEVLRHRVGVHLGDVILAAGDVMGDGVNIAARVQAEAPAGGICISQEVYAVVRNKMKLDVVRLEPRQLKNINEPVQMYRVLLEPPRQRVPIASSPAVATAAEAPSGSAWQKWLALLAGAGAIGAAVFLLLQAQREHQRELAGSQGAREALGAAVRGGGAAPAAAGEGTPAPAASLAAAPAEPDTTIATVPDRSGPTDPFDFAERASNRASTPANSASEESILQAAREALAPLDGWVTTALQRFTPDMPLAVQPLRPTFRGPLLFTDAKRQLWFQEGGAKVRKNWSELPAEMRGAIVAALIRSSPAAPPREISRAAAAFAYVHRLPELADILLQERGGR